LPFDFDDLVHVLAMAHVQEEDDEVMEVPGGEESGDADAHSAPVPVVVDQHLGVQGFKAPPAANVESDGEDDDGAVCTICMEPWTNSGKHRIASLKCGHFFGQECIERWLKTPGAGCPNCNVKANKKDVRVHFVAKLKAIDTSERDRAVADLERTRMELAKVKLEYQTTLVTLQAKDEEMTKLKQQLEASKGAVGALSSVAHSVDGVLSDSNANDTAPKLVYHRRLELIKAEATADLNRVCKILAFSEFHAMLVATQPSFTALSPGFGFRKINVADARHGPYVTLHKEPIRDLAFNPVRHDLLLSASQDKTVKLTNVSSGQTVQKYDLGESEGWSCCWNADDTNLFFVGTKRGKVLMFDTRRADTSPVMEMTFPQGSRLPVIGLQGVPSVRPQTASSAACPLGGLLVLTLTKAWFFEYRNVEGNDYGQYRPHELNLAGPFWSIRYDVDTRLALVSTRPRPHSQHMIVELLRVNMAPDVSSEPDCQVAANVIFEDKRGGSYHERAFLRTALMRHPSDQRRLLMAYSRGAGQNDQRVVVREVGSGESAAMQEVRVPAPVMDITPAVVNGVPGLGILCETEVLLYKWTTIKTGEK